VFGEEGEAAAVLVTVLTVCFKDIDNVGIIRKTRLCCKCLDVVCTMEMSAAHRSRIHI